MVTVFFNWSISWNDHTQLNGIHTLFYRVVFTLGDEIKTSAALICLWYAHAWYRKKYVFSSFTIVTSTRVNININCSAAFCNNYAFCNTLRIL